MAKGSGNCPVLANASFQHWFFGVIIEVKVTLQRAEDFTKCHDAAAAGVWQAS